jgi:hypothetical protein
MKFFCYLNIHFWDYSDLVKLRDVNTDFLLVRCFMTRTCKFCSKVQKRTDYQNDASWGSVIEKH